MEKMVWIFIIVSIILGSLMGAPVIKFLGNKFAKIESVKFWNSFFVCLIATSLVYVFWYFAQETFAERMVGKIIKGRQEYIMQGALIHLFISFALYTLVGKIIWKSSWIKTMKAHIIWVTLNLVIMIIMVFVISEMI